jgi:hypothetical protein
MDIGRDEGPQVVGDLHQPLHDEDDDDKGGNGRHVIFGGKPDNLHWVWDTGMLEQIKRNPEVLATELESKITREDRAAWEQGSIDDWVLEGHRLAKTVAYGDLGHDDPAVITPEYEKQADPVIEMQLEKAGVRLAFVLNEVLCETGCLETRASAVQSPSGQASGAPPQAPETQPGTPKRIKVGGQIEESKKVYAPPPRYPKKAIKA